MSERHEFIVSALARKIRTMGFEILFFEGNSADIGTKKFDFPPKVLYHRPDLVGGNSSGYCIGEAKTENDLFSERTKEQIESYLDFLVLNKNNKLVIGIPIDAKRDLERLLKNLGGYNSIQVDIFSVPMELLPYEEEI